MVWDHLDRGTFEAILRLYRSAPEDRLAAAGARLGSIELPGARGLGHEGPLHSGTLRTPPTRRRLPNSELVELPDAGHWPWIDDPEVVDRVVGFLGPGKSSASRDEDAVTG